MTLKQYLITMLIGAILCWIAWSFVLVNIDPFQDTGVGFGFFYVSLFFALLGTISIVNFLFRYYFSKQDMPLFHFVRKSFGDGLLISAILIILLFLQGKGYLQWWNLIVCLSAIILFLLFKVFNKSKIESNERN